MSFTPLKLTGRQCKTARNLLKWNIHDLSSRVGIPSTRLGDFESGTAHLVPPEMQGVIRVLEQAGIIFHPDSHLTLVDKFKVMMEKKRLQAREDTAKAIAEKYTETTKKPKETKEKPSSGNDK